MSSWNHAICEKCWDATHPFEEVPYRLRAEFREQEICCWCGKENLDGIYIRSEPGKPYCAHKEN